MRRSPISAVSLVLLLPLVLACRERTASHDAGRPATPSSSALCVGSGHACFRTGTGEVLCAGRNLDGQLGDGTHADQSRPVAARGLAGATALACGQAHTCAVAGGRLACWGKNDHGQLGTGDRNNRDVPTVVAGLENVVSVATGDAFTCALTADGKAHCMGEAGDGRLGVARDEDATTPLRVPSLSEAIAIAAGRGHACVVARDGRVKCWGANTRGQLGDGSTTSRPYPRSVPSLAHASSVGAGGDTTCVVADAAVRCFGAGEVGQLGDGQLGVGYGNARPVEVGNLGRVAEVAVSKGHACARLESGRVACWGDGRRGELSRGGFDSFSHPVEAMNASGAAALAVGDGTSCIVRANRAFACWGSNAYGAFGNGNTTPGSLAIDAFASVDDPPRGSARPALTASVPVTPHAPAIALGDTHLCALAADGTVRCTGHPEGGRLGHGGTALPEGASAAQVQGIEDAIDLASQGGTSCVLRASGRIACWGRSEGTLGLPGVRSSSTPIEIAGVTDATDVAVGRGFVCAVRGEGTVSCVGENGFGQLGTGDHLPSEGMLRVAGVSDAVEVAAGGGFACARRANGRVLCWGEGERGQLGRGVAEGSTTPAEVAGLVDAVAISAAGADACAVRRGGTLVCWGESAAGALPTERSTDTFAVRPIPVPGLAGIRRVAVGVGFACALDDHAGVHCFGKNASAQLGVSPTERYASNEPVPVSGGSAEDPLVALACGRDASCGITAQGSVFCWGGGPALERSAAFAEGSTRSATPVPMRGLRP